MISPTVDSAYTYSTAPLLKGAVNLLADESFVIKVTSPSLVDTDYTSFTIVGNTWSLQLSSLVAGLYIITPKVYETATPANFVTGTGTLEVALFTFVIPFKSGAKETLAWLTEILLSNNGTEQRRQLKSLPRMTLQGTYPVNTNTNLTVANEIYSLLGKLTLIPLWHEAQLIPSILQVDNAISIDTRYSSYKVGDYCLIFKKYSEYELVLIATVTDTALAGSIISDYTNSFVLPVKSGIITNNQSSGIGTSESLELTYLFKDLITVSQNSPSSFKGDDVYFDDWFVESELSSSLTNRLDFNDFETGAFTFSAPWNTNKVKANMFFLLENLQEVFEFKQFLYRRQGMLKPFWLSSYKSDFIPDSLTSGATVIGTTLKVLKNGFEKVFADKDNISVHFKDRSFKLATVSSIIIQATTIDLTITPTISEKYSDIAFISFVNLFRLDSDSIELSHETNGVVTSKVPIIECSPLISNDSFIISCAPAVAVGLVGQQIAITENFVFVSDHAWDSERTLRKHSLNGTLLSSISLGAGEILSDGIILFVTGFGGVVSSLNVNTLNETVLYTVGTLGRCLATASSFLVLHDGVLRNISKTIPDSGNEVPFPDPPGMGVAYDCYLSQQGNDLYILDPHDPARIWKKSGNFPIESPPLYPFPIAALTDATITVSPSWIWVTCKPNLLYRINKVTDEISTFTVAGYIETVEVDVVVKYISGTVYLALGELQQIARINESASSNGTLIASTINTPGFKPVNMDKHASGTLYYVGLPV